jgi:heat-inducible transcriptional repressor
MPNNFAETDLTNRHQTILAEIVREYLATGQPVGSKKLAENCDIGLKSASIRKVMCDLERMDLLHAPHTSAGREPTDQGLRYFIDSLMEVDTGISKQVNATLAAHLDRGMDIDGVLQQASDELAQLTHFAGLVSVRDRSTDRIQHVEMVPVGKDRILAVIVAESGSVRQCMLARPLNLSDNSLSEVSRRLSELLADCDLIQARERLQYEMQTDRLRIRGMIGELARWASTAACQEQDLFISGQGQLLDIPELGVAETLRSLLAAFEEKKALLGLIEQVEHSDSETRVFIGAEHALMHMEDVSMVLARYRGPGNLVGTLGVIGPKRMPYQMVLPVVVSTAKRVSFILGGRP